MYIITGGAGFIGSNIAWALEQRGYSKIVIVDRLRDGVKWKNIAKRELFDVVHPDNLFDFLAEHESNVKAIFHMGAISATTETDGDKIMDNNFRLSMDLWKWCTQHKARFIYASSAATYGGGEHGFVDNAEIDALKPLQPLNPYGWSKQLFDRRVARMLDQNEAVPPQWVGLKFFNVYGPNEYHKGTMQSVVSHVYPVAAKGETCKLFKSHHPDYEDGGQLRDFVSVDDCVDLMMWLLDNPDVSGLFNCGTGEARPFKDLAAAVYRALDMDPLIEYIPTPEHLRDKYQYYTQADMSKLKAAGYDKAFTSLEDGVKAYVQNHLHAEDPFR
ncbi:ADP-glyceromanno-heptose 6-epimerase [Magnetovibrio sp. PR-2]|uniref:ADP-glyceromanno-heptose 6-epimerase n=1 Tax=Magnetovibrio sp. PR-2 TaxID=3120356 RepID=UPI002FCDE54C